MDLEEKLTILEGKARKEPALLRDLLRTKDEKNPVGAFCAIASDAGVAIDAMDLICAGEETYAAMRRSTNGGGENSPLLAGEDDYYELFLARLANGRPAAPEDTRRRAACVRFLTPGETDRILGVPDAGTGGEAKPDGTAPDKTGPVQPAGEQRTEAPACGDYIGVFDSGVGGLTVLREMTRLMPYENFLYYGDSANAPYGNKEESWVRERSFLIAESMFGCGAKAIVIACNTATAAAAGPLRGRYPDRIIVGVEPALKVAVNAHQGARFLVMATEVTLKLDKYHVLEERLHGEAEFFPLACDGLAARIEQGNLDADDLHEMLASLLTPYIGEVDGIVLGCTHYPLVKRQILEIFGDIPLYDGGEGTARELRRRLRAEGRAAGEGEQGTVLLASSARTENQKALYEGFYLSVI